jgi:hypothetical protein
MTACVSASALELLRLASEDTESAVPCASKLSAAAQCVSEQVPREDTLLAPKLEGQAAPAGHKSANNPKYLASVVDPTGREVEFEFDDDEIRASGEDVLHKMEVADPDGRTIALNIFARDLADPATAVKKFCDLQSGHGRRGPTVGAWEAWAVDTCAQDIMRNLAPTLDRLRGQHAASVSFPMQNKIKARAEAASLFPPRRPPTEMHGILTDTEFTIKVKPLETTAGLEKLTKLTVAHDDGILTDTEFTSKAKALEKAAGIVSTEAVSASRILCFCLVCVIRCSRRSGGRRACTHARLHVYMYPSDFACRPVSRHDTCKHTARVHLLPARL